MTTSNEVTSFVDTHRTKKYVVFRLDATDKPTYQAVDPFSNKKLGKPKLFKRILTPSINDDFLIDYESGRFSATDLTTDEKKTMTGVPEGCKLTRPRESEQILAERRKQKDIVLVLDCKWGR